MSNPLISAPPPAIMIPLSIMSEASSGGVLSKVCFTISTKDNTKGDKIYSAEDKLLEKYDKETNAGELDYLQLLFRSHHRLLVLECAVYLGLDHLFLVLYSLAILYHLVTVKGEAGKINIAGKTIGDEVTIPAYDKNASKDEKLSWIEVEVHMMYILTFH